MNVLHVIPSTSSADGGPTFAVHSMAQALASSGLNVTVATTSKLTESAPAQENPNLCYRRFHRDLEPYKVSFGLLRWLRGNLHKYDLVHIHALFSFSSTVASRIAHTKKVPYLVRPLGVLNRWGMQNRRRIPKQISFRLVERSILLNSGAIHYTSEAEREEAAGLCPQLAKHSSIVIPLPVHASPPPTQGLSETYPQLEGRRVILFLSRVDLKKGLELLLDAFGLVRKQHPEAALVIAGQGERGYVEELRVRPSVVANSADIFWTGHLDTGMKAAAFAAADVFVLPSASENFGIAAAEALAAGVPTIVSEEVALSVDVRRYKAGLVVKREVQVLASAISELLTNQARAQELAANGKRLVRERYSPDSVGRQLYQLYETILANGAGVATAL